ncbi:MAG: DNA alkylation response protein, partial [Notoacmeibacter sp.]|nr:DNA alkylation response protein [Notoacmeibacter sp.]
SRAFARIAVALAKYWLTKRNPNFVFECMECHRGAGYVEETPMPRLFRESPLNAIWEGSGNVIVLDVLRTLRKEPEALAALFSEIEPGLGRDDDLDMAVQGVKTMLDGPLGEGAGRLLVERLALVLQGALLVRFAPAPVARAFCATRLGGAGGHMFGVMPEDIDVDGILDRHLAALDAGLA